MGRVFPFLQLPAHCDVISALLLLLAVWCHDDICGDSKVFHRFPLSEKSLQPQSEPYLNLRGKLSQSPVSPPLWLGLDLSGAPGAWDGENTESLPQTLPPFCLRSSHTSLTQTPASAFTKPHFGPKHGVFEKGMMEDVLKGVAAETSVRFNPGRWGLTGTLVSRQVWDVRLSWGSTWIYPDFL